MTSRQRILYRLGHFLTRHRWSILAAWLALTTVMTFLTLRLELNLGFLNLLDRQDPEVEKVYYVNENFGGMDYTFISVEHEDLPTAKRFADAYAQALIKEEMVARVVHRISADELMRHAFLFLSPEELRDLEKYLRDNQADMVRIFRDAHVAPFVSNFNDMLERWIIENDQISDEKEGLKTLSSFDDFIKTMAQAFEGSGDHESESVRSSLRSLFFPSEGELSILDEDYFVSDDKGSVLLLVMPSEPGDDLAYTKAFLEVLEGQGEEVAKNFPGIQMSIGGNTAILRDEYEALLNDTWLSTAITFVLVLLIFAFFFRKFSDLILIAICLTVGLIWTYGLTYLFIGYLGVTTAFIAAILLGLGIDFAIHLLARYGEEAQSEKNVPEAVARAMAGSGPGIVTGAVTTGAAFLALLTCNFKGIYELGFVAGTGVLILLAVMMILLPALIAIRDDRPGKAVAVKAKRELLPLTGLADAVVRHRLPVLIVVALATVFMGYFASRARFNYDFRSLEPRGAKGVEANRKFQEDFGMSLDYGVLYADSVEESRRYAESVKSHPAIKKTEDISEYIPENQEEKIPLIKALAPLLAPLTVERRAGEDESLDSPGLIEIAEALEGSARVVGAVRQLAILGGHFDLEEKSGELIGRVNTFSKRIKSGGMALSPGASRYQRELGVEVETLLSQMKASARGEKLEPKGLPRSLKDNFMGDDGRFLIYAYPADYLWNADALNANLEAMRSVTENSTSVGTIFLHLINLIKKETLSAVGLSLLAVFLLVLADLRRIISTILALVPLLLSAVWMVGTMTLLGIEFNLVNVAVVPLIIGIGIDDGIHIVHRYRMEKTDRIHQAIKHTGRAILLTSMTTISGFGSLGFASYILIASLGWVLAIGVAYCFFASVLVLPALMSYVEKWVEI